MKHVLTFVAFFLIAAACSSAPKVEAPGELYADILVKRNSVPPSIEISFYTKTRQQGNRMEYTKSIIAVEEPRLNDQALNPISTGSGNTSYSIGTAGVKVDSVLSAKVSGKVFQAKTLIDLVQDNKMTTVTMSPQ